MVVPFGHSVVHWPELIGDLAELGEDLIDNVLQFFQPLWAYLGYIVHHHHGVDAVSLEWLLPHEVTQQLWGQ